MVAFFAWLYTTGPWICQAENLLPVVVLPVGDRPFHDGEDVGEVVEYAESVQKLFDDDGNNLGKKRLEAMTVYAEYTVDGDTATVTRVYKHRVSLEEDN